MNIKSQQLIVLAVALLFRAVYAWLVWTPAMESPEEGMYTMYGRTAYFLAAGQGYTQAVPGSPAYSDIEEIRTGMPFGARISTAEGDRIASEGRYSESLHPPGWSLVAAGIHKVFGIPIWFGMQALGVLVDSLAAVLLYTLVVVALGNAQAAFIASMIYALFPPLAYQAVLLVPMGFMTLFGICATIFAVKSVQAQPIKKVWMYLALAGLFIGIGSYFRSDIALLGPFFAIGFAIHERRLLMPALKGFFVLLITILVLFPWAYRNHVTQGKWIFTSSALGINLMNGLGEYDNPWNIGGSDRDRHQDARAAGIPHGFHPDADTLFRRMFVESVTEHPGAWLGILARRAVEQPVATPYNWGIKVEKTRAGLTQMRVENRLAENVGYIIRTYWFRLLSAGFMFLCLCGSVWTIVAMKAWRSEVMIIMASPLYYALSHIAIHMEPRYLLPGAFALFVGLSCAVIGLKSRLSRRKQRLTEAA